MIRELRLYFTARAIAANWQAYRKDHPMLTVQQVFKSRTFWTLVATALFNGVNTITPEIKDPNLVAAINGALSLLALAFRIAPNQHVEKPK